VTKKSYSERAGKTPPKHMVERGEDLAASAIKCAGKPHSEFIDCISKDQAHKHPRPKKKKK
jgi:hypothetical protein